MKIAAMIRSFLKIGLIGFGGGSTLIPVVEKEIVQERGLISTELYEEHTIAANLTPGALPTKLAAAVGQEKSGAWASFVCAVAVSAPGTLATIGLLVVLSVLPAGFLFGLELAAVGVLTFISLILLAYIQSVQKTARRDGYGLAAMIVMMVICLLTAEKEIRALILLFAPALGSWISPEPWLDMSITDVLLLTFAIVCLSCVPNIWKKGTKKGGKAQVKPIALQPIVWQVLLFAGVPIVMCVACVWLGLARLDFFWQGTLSTITSFGGGSAYVAVADSVFAGGGFITREALYTQLMPVANALPGPVLVKLLAGIGYYVGLESGGMPGGLMVAVTCMAVGIGATCTVFVIVYAIYRCFAELTVFVRLKQWIMPVVCGLLLTTIFAMVESVLRTCVTVGLLPLVGVGLVSVLAVGGYFLGKRVADVLGILILGGGSLLVLWGVSVVA